ncbi:MAG: type II secretion system F family protein [Candidatus Omnitrophota bacterium]|nr:type II secretion system F family protein [Candidatus Omnitrophota bacterium]
MPKFIYEAKTGPNDVIKGGLVAESKNAAVQKISQLGYFLLSLEEESGISNTSVNNRASFHGRINLKDITDFTRQLSDLLEAGINIAKALDILQSQTVNKRLKKVISDVKDFCVSGNPLSDALSRHPKVFPNLYVSMVRSGETGGMLEGILRRLSDFNEKQLEIQTKVKTALAYPILMAVVGFATVAVLITFVIPKMVVMFADFGQALPIPTQILLFISTVVRKYWLVLIGLCAAIVIIIRKMYRTSEGRRAIDRFKLDFPLTGQLIRKVEIARFARTLSTLLENGVPILEAMNITLETLSNTIIKEDIEKAYLSVREGASLASSLNLGKIMPASVINMIAVGEEGGHMEKSLLKIAQGYERESDEAIKIMMSLLEPVMILTLGGIVGFIVVAMLLPIFEMNFLVR